METARRPDRRLIPERDESDIGPHFPGAYGNTTVEKDFDPLALWLLCFPFEPTVVGMSCASIGKGAVR